jgi:hypothetical protein
MKQLLFTALFFTVSAFCFAQSTTETEYNYMKTGYKNTLESGMDIKAGYNIEDIITDAKYSNITITAKMFKRTTNNTVAGIILKTSDNSGFGIPLVSYFAIPAPSTTTKKSYGWDEWNATITNMSSSLKTAVLQWAAYEMSYTKTLNSK